MTILGLVLEILRLCLRMTILGPVLACKIGLPRLTYGANRLTCVYCLSDTVREFPGTQLTFRIMDFLRMSIRHHLFSGECDPALGKSILQARQTNRKSFFVEMEGR